MAAFAVRGKDVLRLGILLPPPQHLHHFRGEYHGCRLTGLELLCRDGPSLAPQVDVGPAHRLDVPAAGAGVERDEEEVAEGLIRLVSNRLEESRQLVRP